MRISTSSPAALRGNDAITRLDEVLDNEAAGRIDDHRSRGNWNCNIASGSSMPIRAATMAAGFRLPLLAVHERGQRVDTVLGNDNHTTAVTAIASVGPSPRNETLAPKTEATVASVSCDYFDLHAVDEHPGPSRNGRSLYRELPLGYCHNVSITEKTVAPEASIDGNANRPCCQPVRQSPTRCIEHEPPW